METLKLIEILEANVKLLKSKQECVKMKSDQAKGENAVKVEDAEWKAQMAAKAELAKKDKEIEALGIQIGQMYKEANAQKALENEYLQTIGQLRSVIEKQTKEAPSNSLRYINCLVLSFIFCGALIKSVEEGHLGAFALSLSGLYLCLPILFGYYQ